MQRLLDEPDFRVYTADLSESSIPFAGEPYALWLALPAAGVDWGAVLRASVGHIQSGCRTINPWSTDEDTAWHAWEVAVAALKAVHGDIPNKDPRFVHVVCMTDDPADDAAFYFLRCSTYDDAAGEVHAFRNYLYLRSGDSALDEAAARAMFTILMLDG